MSTLARATSIRSIRSIELVCLYLVSVAGFLVSTATLSLDTEDGMGMGMLTLAFGGWALFSNVARAAHGVSVRGMAILTRDTTVKDAEHRDRVIAQKVTCNTFYVDAAAKNWLPPC